MKIVLVFDGDDTCWMNAWQYERARAYFFCFLYDEFRDLMPGRDFLSLRYKQNDEYFFPVWGIQRGRVFFGMRKTYQELLDYFKEKLGENSARFKTILAEKDEHEKKIFEFGDMPFNFYELSWVEGLRELLAELKRDKRFAFCLLTSYDVNVWRDRGKHLEADKYFSRIKTVWTKKTAQDFIEVSNYENEPLDTIFYTVGNAAPTDILTAVGISERWCGIHIPHPSSSPIFTTESGSEPYSISPLEHPRVITLRSILELRRMDFENFRLKEPGE